MAGRYGDRVVVDFAMRYGNPSTPSVLERLRAAGCQRILFFPLYPQYSAPTTATANDQAFRALMRMRWQPAIRTVPAYHDHPLYIEALARSVERTYAGLDTRPELLVTSYHGMPERYLREGDPYHCHCRKTTRLLTARLGFAEDEVVVSFQSKFGPEEWLKPYTVEEVARQARAGRRRIAVIAPAFSSDCVETLEEVNGEIRESFMHAGGEAFSYVPCLNADEAHIDMIEAIATTELAGWIGESDR
jgi:ferrochelatase